MPPGGPATRDRPALGTEPRTVRGNSNGGLYLIPAPLLPDVALAWARWARWLLDRPSSSQWTVYIDQVAMAMAISATGSGALALEVRWNTPVHAPSTIPPHVAEPSIIHYHQQVDRRGRLLTTGVPSIDRRITTANRAIDRLWPDGFPPSTYEEWLSLGGPEPTAGTGRTADPSICSTGTADPGQGATWPAVTCGDGSRPRVGPPPGVLLFGGLLGSHRLVQRDRRLLGGGGGFHRQLGRRGSWLDLHSRGHSRPTTGGGQGQLVGPSGPIDQIPGPAKGDQRDQRGESSPLAIVAPALVAAHEGRHRMD